MLTEKYRQKIQLAELLLSGKNETIIQEYRAKDEAKEAFNGFKEELKHLKGLK